METKAIEHECMTCGAVYWGDDKPQFCPRCNGSMVREVETSDDQLGELMDNVIVMRDLGSFDDYMKARAALREYVDALVKGGITAQIADLLEQVAALQERIESLEYTKDEYWQVIQAKTERIAELEKSIIESGIKIDLLKSELQERDE